MKVWIDADACPKIVKELVFKASFRLKVDVCLVANSYLNIPLAPNLSFIQVDKGADVADFYIVEHSKPEDLVVTADIPLAALIVEKGATQLILEVRFILKRISVKDYLLETLCKI